MGFCRLDVYCDKIRENIEKVRAQIDPCTNILVVAKANAYGLGAAEICRILQNDVDYFAFATIEEAIEVRESGCLAPKILLLSEPLKRDIPSVIAHNISLGVYNKSFITELNRFLLSQVDTEIVVETHFKVDTGLQRLGNSDEEVLEYWLHDTCPRLMKTGLWSHLQNSEHGEVNDVTNKSQFQVFNKIQAKYSEFKLLRHLCNSYATEFHPEVHYDMVRPGVISWENTFKLTVLVKHVFEPKKGTNVGYGCNDITVGKYVCDGSETMAVLGIGYADGLSTKMSNDRRIWVVIKGVKCELVSSVMMDMCIVKCGDGLEVECEDEAVFISDGSDGGMTVADIQKVTGEGSRELMVHFGRRIARVYHE